MHEDEVVQDLVLPDGGKVGIVVKRGDDLMEVSASPLDFKQISSAVIGIASALKAALNEVKPQKASIEFGLEFKVEPGQVVALICKGTGGASLKITLEYGDQGHAL